MTNDEKAKAYDEALKRAKTAIDIAADKDLVVGVVRTIFPEPRESEDERIRTFLLDYAIEMIAGLESDISLSTYDGIKGHDPDAEAELTQWQKARAYLEKQKDASKAIEAVDRIDKYIDEHLANAHDMKDSNPDKKYYRGWDDALGKMSGILQDVYSGEKQKEQNKCPEFCSGHCVGCELKEQKPVVSHGETYHVDTLGTQQVIAGKMPQKPAEWSEEDEKMRDRIIDILNRTFSVYSALGTSSTRPSYPTYKDEIAWLKHLRPSWKPSEEQMEALMLAIEGKCPPTSYMSRRLEDLYDGLSNTYGIDAKLD